MANKHQVIELHKRDPLMSCKEIAYALECEGAYVRATFYRNGLRLPSRTTKADIYALGRAAHAAGLTLAMLTEIAAENRQA